MKDELKNQMDTWQFTRCPIDIEGGKWKWNKYGKEKVASYIDELLGRELDAQFERGEDHFASELLMNGRRGEEPSYVKKFIKLRPTEEH